MAKGARWVRLSVDWSSSDWLAELPFDVRSCWPLLLCYVKTNGVGGECSVRKPATLARLWDAPERAVSALIDAAIEEGAVIVTDETLVVVKWADYQDDVASRVRRHRDHKRENQSDSVKNEPDVTLLKRVVTNVTDVTADRDIDRDIDIDIPPIVPQGGRGRVLPTLEEWIQYATSKGLPEAKAKEAWHYYESNGWLRAGRQPIVKWRSCVATCLLRYEESQPKASRLPRASQVGAVT